jgi:hypothetical protein
LTVDTCPGTIALQEPRADIRCRWNNLSATIHLSHGFHAQTITVRESNVLYSPILSLKEFLTV